MLKSVLRTPPSITASPAVYVAPFCVALMIIPARVMNIVVIGSDLSPEFKTMTLMRFPIH